MRGGGRSLPGTPGARARFRARVRGLSLGSESRSSPRRSAVRKRAMKAAFRRLLQASVLRTNCVLPLTSGERFIFVFHDVSERSEPHFHRNYSVTPETFAEQVE